MIYSILEGKQAEEYKARKAKEREDYERKDLDRANNRYVNSRYGPGNKMVRGLNPNYKSYRDDPKSHDDDENRHNMARYIVNRDYNNKNHTIFATNPVDPKKFKSGAPHYKPKGYVGSYYTDSNSDAVNRHIRRHPKQYAKPKNESTIFSDIEII